ncbi:DUF2256 domain-containing protein [Sphingomonas profundi]|uniref:DUF2256 domain-containing protein n=1 Tax=Alterirhizorhabdus profundi TaxID=2681549 RepID=UPI0012E756D1|nr:DUF2256 domain-containing protein [Sphingomonas profundi]
MRSGATTHKKLNLPTKDCASCHRPFAWRKKWARDWEQVRYCSDRCRAAGAKTDPNAADR